MIRQEEPLRFVMIGAGFWASYQLSAWREIPGARCVGVCDTDRVRADELAARFGIADVFTEAGEALEKLRPDFADIVTPPATHAPLALVCARKGIATICQKPLAQTLQEAEAMLAAFDAAGVALLVHENWRWQAPMRALAEALRRGEIGTPFRARLTFSCSFPVFENQPFLATLPRFILTDIGSHVLDCARFLFGEAQSVTCLTSRVNSKIAGEDVATVLLSMGTQSTTVVVEMSYASALENERFPQTYVVVEGSAGSLELGPDYLLSHTNGAGTTIRRRIVPPRHAWADPQYDLVQASMVPYLQNILSHLNGTGIAETTGRDNYETMRLVFAAYESAEGNGKTIRL